MTETKPQIRTIYTIVEGLGTREKLAPLQEHFKKKKV